MATPLKERPKVLIPLPPLPEFYQTATEGNAMAEHSSTSSSSHARQTAKSTKSSKKVVAAVEVRSRAKSDSRPPPTPGLPPAKPLPIEVIVDARPTLSHGHSLPPVKLPPFPPPPPPGFESDNHENMSHRYSYYHRHTSKHPVYEAKPMKDPQTQPARTITIPPPPPGYPGVLVETKVVAQPTLTVYHVCRICMRPRSEKYHLEHPVSSDGVLPLPGICKRCRITSVEEKNDLTKLVHVEESDKVRVGISAFLPKDNLYTRREASEAIKKQQRKAYSDLYVREPSSEEEEPERVVYRYVKRTKKSVPDPPLMERPEVSVENLATMNLMNDRYSPRLATGRTTMQVNVGGDYENPPGDETVRYPAQNVRVTEIKRVERSQAPDSLLSSKSSTPSVSTAKDQSASSAKASVSVKSSVAGSQSNVKASAQVTTTAAPGYTESEIRTFARDEVERYRQAERMMHAHPSTYAHGRMVPVTPAVPVERRIEAVRDTAAPKPWEVPASPPREATFATLKGRYSSTASKDGTGHLERGPSEDSRHWYPPTQSSSSATKSTSSKGSASTIRQQSTRQSGVHGSSATREYDTEITVEHKRKTEVSRGPPERDPPNSVELREVVGIIREEPVGTKHRTVSSGRRYSPDVIEVTEEIELPPGAELRAASIRAMSPVISQRVKILRGGKESQQRQRTTLSPPGRDFGHSREASLRTDKSYWEDEGVVKTASRHSSSRQGGSEVRGSERQSRVDTDLTIRESEKLYSTAPLRQFLPNLSSHGRSDDDSWYASRVKGITKHQQIPERPSSPPKPQDDGSDKTVWHPDQTPLRPAASSIASMVEDAEDDDDWDWEYRKRIVTASDRPPGRIDDESAPGRHYTDTERLFRRRRPSQSSARDAEPSTHSSHVQARQPPSTPPIPEIVISTEVEQESPQERGRGPYMRTSEESAHVHFASKVEFSPTPPRSDESLPDQIRQSKPSSRSSRGSTKKSALRNQIDGGASEPPESVESLLAEYETTRSRRSRSIERERVEDINYVSVKHASSARGSGHSGPSAQHSSRSEPRSFRSQESRRSTRTREDYDSAQAPPHDDDERRSGRSARRSSGEEDAETATQLSRSRALARALSESPSRERMQQEYLRVQQEQELRSETVVSRGRRSDWGEQPEEDGKGPYREERRTESMDALYGSGHGGPKSKQREYIVREKW